VTWTTRWCIGRICVKCAEEYTATTPPPVVAARKSLQAGRRLVSYMITTAGPEPMDHLGIRSDASTMCSSK